MQADTIQLTCQCGRTLAVPASAAGKTAQCPACGHQLPILSTNDTVSAAPSTQSMTTNPYAPVGGTLEEIVVTPDDAEAMRRYYLSHEVSVKSLGLLFILSGLVTMLMGIRLLVPLIVTQAAQRPQLDVHFFLAAGVILLGAIQFFTGFGLRRLNATARIFGVFVCAVSLFSFPVGTIISVYFLYLLLSMKGQMIFRPEYQQVVAVTPNVRYHTPGYIWVAASVLAVLLVLVLVTFMLRS